MSVSLLDYGAGNVRSIINAIQKLGYELKIVQTAQDLAQAEKLVFPGVGAFGACMEKLEEKKFLSPLKAYLSSGKPFFGICIGMQTLFEGSEESPGVPGLGIIPGIIKKFDNSTVSVPHMGWNGIKPIKSSEILSPKFYDKFFYFVHSYAAEYKPESVQASWAMASTDYGTQSFLSIVQRDKIFATQFHPEKSGSIGLDLLKAFLECPSDSYAATLIDPPIVKKTFLSKRIIACLDVRSNDDGDLVVTKGDQYDVREKVDNAEKGKVRNLGKPVELAQRYFEEGADEITFLNITSFRNCPLKDLPVLDLLKETSKKVFVPLTIGGGIRDMVDKDGRRYSALEVASEYFRSGADKVSIGGDAVAAVQEYFHNNSQPLGTSSIEQIARVYGSQAVVISVDAKRIYVSSPKDTTHHLIKHQQLGPNNEEYCWYQCTVQGGRGSSDIDVKQLTTACCVLGAGEILLNCIDHDGTNGGYDLDLIEDVKSYIKVPVIASSGAGKVEHFGALFDRCGNVESALAAGIFHRKEVSVRDVKDYLKDKVVVRD
eukprot:TRINITY_DN3670_c0_g1_i1.p1 TRINITY_DN3670_c0_g1~~TRINITY_DN3670_c0_g1_i1.p1  ORF type:complete len:543 (-),score=124.85 TRINITY_DN3670_c0_g1_i1:7-1635(-)